MPILHSSCSVLSAVLESLVIPVKSTFRAELEMLGLWLTNYVYMSVNFLMSWNLISITLMKLEPSWPSDQEQKAWAPFSATRKFAGLFLKKKKNHLVEELVIDLALQQWFCMLGIVTWYCIQLEQQFMDKSEFIQASMFAEFSLKKWYYLYSSFFCLELLFPPGKYKSDIFIMNLIWKLALEAELALEVVLLLIL